MLVPDLTAREHLELFASLKSLKNIPELIAEKAETTSLESILDTKV